MPLKRPARCSLAAASDQPGGFQRTADEQSHDHEARQQRVPPITHQGKRQACCWHGPGGYSHIHDRLADKQSGTANGDETRLIAAAAHCHAKAQVAEQHQKEQQKQRADEPEFLGVDSKDEICALNRQILHFLCGEAEPLPEQPS